MSARPENVRIVLASRLGELEGLWLHMTCGGCAYSTARGLGRVAQMLGPMHQLGAIVPRLVCARCGAKPATVHLGQTHMLEFCYGGDPGWNVQLFPGGGERPQPVT